MTYSLCYSEINLKCSEESFHMMEKMLWKVLLRKGSVKHEILPMI